LRYIWFCKHLFSIKMFHIWLRGGGGGGRIISIFILNDRAGNFIKE
jgi:hypothetical protein